MEQYALTFYRDREEAVKGTKHSISENNEPVKDDATIASFVDDAVKPVFEEENNLDEKATSDEEFDCSSVTVSSEAGKEKLLHWMKNQDGLKLSLLRKTD